MTTASQPAAALVRSPPPAIRWRVWPLVQGGPANALVVGAITAAAAMVGLATRNPAWALVALALTSAAAWRLFVPITFEINSQGVFQEFLGRRERIGWRAIHGCQPGQAGVFLSLGGPLPLFRGLYVPWQSHRAEVLALLDYYLMQIRHDERALEFEIHP